MRTYARLSLVLPLLLALGGCDLGRRREVASVSPPPAAPSPATTPARMQFTATAYSQEGKTASGAQAREGIVAADPAVLPIGSRIRVDGAGQYSGEYVVKDTGRRIDGREIDLYMANDGEAQRFGKRQVTVEILHRGAR